MTEPLRQNGYAESTEGYAPRFKPRVIEMIQEHLAKREKTRTSSITGEEPYVLDLPELQTIGWVNIDKSGSPYPNLWAYVFGEFNIDARFDSIPAKVQGSGCYLGLFRNHRDVPKLWEYAAWDSGFFLAVEVEQTDAVPEGLEPKVFPASRYAVFIARGVPHLAYRNTWEYIHNEWLPESDYRFNEEGVFFINFTEKSGPDDERFEAHMCVPIVRK